MITFAERCKLEGVKLDFESFLMDKHAEQYVGTDDMMVDDYAEWIEDLGAIDLIEYEKEYISNLQVPEPRGALDEEKAIDSVKNMEWDGNPNKLKINVVKHICQKFGKVKGANNGKI